LAAALEVRAGLRVRATRRAAGRDPLVRDALIILFSFPLKYPPRQAEYFSLPF
jgi:hypothetical protein